jgi:Leucine-rich repeat (LRR) protein
MIAQRNTHRTASKAPPRSERYQIVALFFLLTCSAWGSLFAAQAEMTEEQAVLELQKQDPLVQIQRDDVNPTNPVVRVRTGLLGKEPALELLKHLKHLRHLDLLPARDRDLVYIKDLSSLRTLSIGGPDVSDDGLRNLAGLTDLLALRLNFTNCTDEGLSHIEKLIHLHSLSLMGTRVTDAGLEHLKGLVNLKWLTLRQTRVTDAGLEHLKKLPDLAFLDLAQTRITDAGLKRLGELTQLHMLDVSGNQITDTGMMYLGTSKKLEHLCLFSDDGGVTPQGEAMLKKSIPSVRILRVKR